MEEETARLANVKQLEAYTYLSIVDQYAKAYGKFPREVNAERFDDVMPMIILWRKQADFSKRYMKIYESLNKKND